jgi:organic radical activating enzyme
VTPTGKLKACCQSLDTPTGSYDNIGDWFTSHEMTQLRDALYNGQEHPWCQRCWDSQRIGQQSLRESYNQGLFDSEVKAVVKSSASNNYQADKILFLDLKLGNLCNLKCVMCGPESSSRIMSEWSQHKNWFSIDKFQGLDFSWPERDEFKQLATQTLPSLKYVKFTGGEPFLNPYINDLLGLLPEDCLVHITTNLTLLDDAKIKLLQRFKHMWINASIDAVGDLYEIIRYPATWTEVESNILKIKEKLPNADFSIAVTVSALSILQIDKTLNFLPGVVGLIPVNKPKYMSLNAIPDNLVPAIAARVANIADVELRNQVQQLLNARIFSSQDWQEHNEFIGRIKHIRNTVVDVQQLLDAK